MTASGAATRFRGPNMRLILLVAALTTSVSARPDPRAPFDGDALRSATGIMAFAEVPLAPAGVHAKFHYDTVPVANGITTFIEGPSHGLVQGNITLIVGEQSALVIDTGQFPAVARRVIADMRKLTDKPVRYVAITHWHMDHYMANSEFADAWPGLTIIAQDFTAPMMDKYGARYARLGPKLEENMKPLRDMLASGKTPDGGEIAPDRRARVEAAIADMEADRPEFELMRYRGADMTFENEIDIDLGNRMVKLMHLGRGNTAGDLVAYVPDAHALITGDLLVHPVPYSYGSYLTEWSVVLGKLADLDATVIVPGHGPVMHDKAYVRQVRELLDGVVGEVKRVWKPGMSGDDVRKVMDLSKQRDAFCHGDKSLEGSFRASIETAGVDRVTQELGGNMKPESFDESN
ncbi:MAG TPA: MBL fold metallo-hydrolase [Rudaea sp.]|jgi:glyoxylase-like metal-dependent hydrolase (beta-lactamase superfamily II)